MRTRCSHCQTDNGVLRVLGRPTGLHLRCRGCGRTIRVVESLGAVFGVTLAFGVGYLIGYRILLDVPPPAAVATALSGAGELLWYGVLPTLPGALLALLTLGALARRSGTAPPEDERVSPGIYALGYVTAACATLAIVALGVYALTLSHSGHRLAEPAVPAEPAVVAAAEPRFREFRFTPLGAADGAAARDLASFEGRPVFLHVFDVADPSADAVLAGIARLGAKLAESGIAFVACTVGDAGALRDFATAPGAPRLPFAHADEPPPDGLVATGRPATTVLDRSGAIVLRHGGPARWDTDEVIAFLRRVAAR